jgi:hypothetical protein
MTDPSSTSHASEAQLRKIAETFAPVVWLHKDDEYRPSSVKWYLEIASLEYNNKKEILKVGEVNTTSLINQKEGSDYSDFTQQPNNRNQKFNFKN